MKKYSEDRKLKQREAFLNKLSPHERDKYKKIEIESQKIKDLYEIEEYGVTTIAKEYGVKDSSLRKYMKKYMKINWRNNRNKMGGPAKSILKDKNTGKKLSQQTKDKIKDGNVGKQVTQEFRDKMRQITTERYKNEKQKEKDKII